MLTTRSAWSVFSASLAALLLMTAGIALAQETTNASSTPQEPPPPPRIAFPIPELGGCSSKESCRAYCDREANKEACVAYAETHGLMTRGEAQKARQFIKFKGPGGCTTPRGCRAYCGIEANHMECLNYAHGSDLISPIEKKILEAIVTSAGPGGCTTFDACKTYCADPAHRDECRKFAEDNNIPPPRMLERREMDPAMGVSSTSPRREGPPAQLRGKTDLLLEEKAGPGGCTSVNECKTYCSDRAHADECLAFAEENGLMTAAERGRAAQVLQEVGPGGCRGMECQEYCADESNAEECLTFAQSRGIMSSDEARAARTLLIEGGPGGCKGPAECRAYCADQSHADECFAFAQTHGMVGQREEVPAGRPAETRSPRPQFTEGPGGCTSPQECTEYCRANQDQECDDFQPRVLLERARQTGGPQEMSASERCGVAGGTWDGARCLLPGETDRYMIAPPTGEGGAPVVRPLPPSGMPPLPSSELPPSPRRPSSVSPSTQFVAAVASLFIPLFKDY